MSKLIGAVLAAALIIPNGAGATVLLEVDLSVLNTITISATSGASDATVSGRDNTGVYLDGFFGASGSSLFGTLLTGNLTNSLNPSDSSPQLFRGGLGTDTGLNIWSWSSASIVNFVAGTTAFTGSATWTLPAASYTEALAGATSGSLYFPADSFDDLPSATMIGEWQRADVSAGNVPLPGTMLLIASGLLGAGFLRRSRR